MLTVYLNSPIIIYYINPDYKPDTEYEKIVKYFNIFQIYDMDSLNQK